MSIHINDFEKPAALESERLRALTGCPINRRIDSVCTEPGCPNNGTLLQIIEASCIEVCLRDPALADSHEETAAPEVYKTEPKQRCIL